VCQEVKILCEQFHGCIANVREVIKHDRTQTAIAYDRLNRSSLNMYVHAAKMITNLISYVQGQLYLFTYIITQQIHIIGIDQQLMCTI
jgi:hypothetical protein